MAWLSSASGHLARRFAASRTLRSRLPVLRRAASSLTSSIRCARSRGGRIRKVASASRSAAGAAVSVGRHPAARITIDARRSVSSARSSSCPAGAIDSNPLAAARSSHPVLAAMIADPIAVAARVRDALKASPARRRRRRRPCRPLRRFPSPIGARNVAAPPSRASLAVAAPAPRRDASPVPAADRSPGIELPIRIDEFVAEVRVPRTDRAQRGAVSVRPVGADDQQRIGIGQVGLTRCRRASIQLFSRRTNRRVERVARPQRSVEVGRAQSDPFRIDRHRILRTLDVNWAPHRPIGALVRHDGVRLFADRIFPLFFDLLLRLDNDFFESFQLRLGGLLVDALLFLRFFEPLQRDPQRGNFPLQPPFMLFEMTHLRFVIFATLGRFSAKLFDLLPCLASLRQLLGEFFRREALFRRCQLLVKLELRVSLRIVANRFLGMAAAIVDAVFASVIPG